MVQAEIVVLDRPIECTAFTKRVKSLVLLQFIHFVK